MGGDTFWQWGETVSFGKTHDDDFTISFRYLNLDDDAADPEPLIA